MGLLLIEGKVPVLDNELWAVDGQLLVGIHGDEHASDVSLKSGKKVKGP